MTRMTNISSVSPVREVASVAGLRQNVILDMNPVRAQAAASDLGEIIVQKALAAFSDPSKYAVASDSPEAALLDYLKKLPSSTRLKVTEAARELVAAQGMESAIHKSESSIQLVQRTVESTIALRGAPQRLASLNVGATRTLATPSTIASARTHMEVVERPVSSTSPDLQFYTAKLLVDKISCKKEMRGEPGADEMCVAAVHFKTGTQVSSVKELEDKLVSAVVPVGSFRTGDTRKNDVRVLEFNLERDPDIAKERYECAVTLVEQDLSKESLKVLEFLLKAAALLASFYFMTDLRAIADTVFQILKVRLGDNVFTAQWLDQLQVSMTDGFGGDEDTKEHRRLDFDERGSDYRVWFVWELSSHTA